MSEYIDTRFAETVFLVEADGFAMQELWYKFSLEALQYDLRRGVKPDPDMPRLKWVQCNPGHVYTLGYIKKRPICVSFFWNKLNGHSVCFYDGCSELVDHEMIDGWLRERCNPRWDSGTRRAHCDATNFHHCISAIRELDKR